MSVLLELWKLKIIRDRGNRNTNDGQLICSCCLTSFALKEDGVRILSTQYIVDGECPAVIPFFDTLWFGFVGYGDI